MSPEMDKRWMVQKGVEELEKKGREGEGAGGALSLGGGGTRVGWLRRSAAGAAAGERQKKWWSDKFWCAGVAVSRRSAHGAALIEL